MATISGTFNGARHVDVGLCGTSLFNVGSLSASAQWDSGWIDLYSIQPFLSTIVAQKNGLASAGEYLQVEQSPDNGVTSYGISPSYNAGAIAYNNTSNINMAVHSIPTMRYIRLVFKNGSTAQTALKLSLGFLKGI